MTMRDAWPGLLRLAARSLIAALALALVAAGCRKGDESSGSATASASEAGGAVGADFQPARPIPSMHPWLSWAKLRLGMSSLELSQVYNAPEGRGDGFTRVQQYFGAAVNQYITFDRPAGEDGKADENAPLRKLICAFYRDQLFRLIDRREGISADEARQFHDECTDKFGVDCAETIGGAQWIWRDDAEDITVTFTQDNASEQHMTAQLEICHMPTWRAWQAYNRDWAEKHPAKPEEKQQAQQAQEQQAPQEQQGESQPQ